MAPVSILVPVLFRVPGMNPEDERPTIPQVSEDERPTIPTVPVR